MSHCDRRVNCAFDLEAHSAKLGEMCGIERQAHRFAVDDGVESAAERDVDTDAPRAERHVNTALQHERWHVDERNAFYLARLRASDFIAFGA